MARARKDVSADSSALPLDLSGWRILPERLEPLPGQLPLFDAGIPLADLPKRERRDRKAGQGFLFDETED